MKLPNKPETTLTQPIPLSTFSDNRLQYNALLDITVRHLPIGTILFDPNGRVVFANMQGANYLGYASVEELLIQKNLASMRERLFETFVLTLESGDPYTAAQSPVVLAMKHKKLQELIVHFRHKKTGAENWLVVTANPVVDPAGELAMIVYSLTDITTQKFAEQVVRDSEKLKDDFLGIASHELKTPVTSIKAYTQVLETKFRKSGDLRSAEFMKKMDMQVNKLTNLIGELLDVTKIRTGKLPFHPVEFSLNDLVSEVVEEIQRTTSQHTIRMELERSGILYCDRERISQVITNLLTNAIKYSPNADTVLIKTVTQRNRVTLSVQDFGIGIPPENLDKIFGQFYQVTNTHSHSLSGLGLGLYISAEIITRENGRIWVESTPGKGSTFYVALPLKPRTSSR
jgi:signal transduction histidine kinase